MFTQLKGQLIHSVSSLFYPIVILSVFFFPAEMRYEKAAFMTVFSIISLLTAITLYRRIRLIEDTPSTSLNSAAQGYMAMAGKTSLYDGENARGPHPELPPMLWYKNYMFQSWAGFLLSDEDGRCTLDPRGAEVITPRYSYNDHHYNAIYPGEMIYVIGQLHTLKKHRNDFERNALVSKKIRELKSNKHQFLEYFDSNDDGKIDEREMQTAKNAASNFVDMALEELYQKPATHVVSQAKDGRPFIVTSIHPEKLLRRYKRALYFHICAWLILSLFILIMQVA